MDEVNEGTGTTFVLSLRLAGAVDADRCEFSVSGGDLRVTLVKVGRCRFSGLDTRVESESA